MLIFLFYFLALNTLKCPVEFFCKFQDFVCFSFFVCVSFVVIVVFWGGAILCVCVCVQWHAFLKKTIHVHTFLFTVLQQASPQTWCCPRCALTRTSLTDSTAYLQMWMTSCALSRGCLSERYRYHHAFTELPLIDLNVRHMCLGLITVECENFVHTRVVFSPFLRPECHMVSLAKYFSFAERALHVVLLGHQACNGLRYQNVCLEG